MNIKTFLSQTSFNIYIDLAKGQEEARLSDGSGQVIV